MNSRERKKWYAFLVDRDGEKCNICGIRGTKKTLVIDHINNNNSDDRPENHQLLCRRCNFLKNRRGSVDNVCVSVCEERPLPPEMEKNLRTEPRFRQWLYEIVLKEGRISYQESLYWGAEEIGASTETVRRYLRKMTSRGGLYVVLNDGNGNPYLQFKDSL